MTEYTPVTQQVKDAYVRAMRAAFIASTGEHREEFDRWLNEIRAEAWDEAISSVFERAESFRGESSLETFLLKHGGRTAAIQAKNPYREPEK